LQLKDRQGKIAGYLHPYCRKQRACCYESSDFQSNEPIIELGAMMGTEIDVFVFLTVPIAYGII
jgi:hypothetical protein